MSQVVVSQVVVFVKTYHENVSREYENIHVTRTLDKGRLRVHRDCIHRILGKNRSRFF